MTRIDYLLSIPKQLRGLMMRSNAGNKYIFMLVIVITKYCKYYSVQILLFIVVTISRLKKSIEGREIPMCLQLRICSMII